MKNIKYQSRATNPLKAIHRTLGFAFYCERRKDEITLKKSQQEIKSPDRIYRRFGIGTWQNQTVADKRTLRIL